MKRKIAAFLVTALAMTGSTGASPKAAADETAPTSVAFQLAPGHAKMLSSTKTFRGDRICRKARRIDHEPGRCARKAWQKRGKSKKVTRRHVAAMGMLQVRGANTGMTLGEAAKIPAPLYCATWWQQLRGAYYVNWKERHEGKFCYNGSDVWVSKKMGGYHHCDLGYGYGYDVNVKECSENKIFVDTVPGYGYQNWDIYKVHAAYKGFPLAASHDMHMNVYPSGNVYDKW